MRQARFTFSPESLRRCLSQMAGSEAVFFLGLANDGPDYLTQLIVAYCRGLCLISATPIDVSHNLCDNSITFRFYLID